MFVRRLPKKSDLPSITTAPLADQQVQSKSEPFGSRKRMIECLGLETGGIPAREKERADSRLPNCNSAVKQIH
jgi:hypothetical protein